MKPAEMIPNEAFEPFCGELLAIPAGAVCGKPFLLTDPAKTKITVGADATANIAIRHTTAREVALSFELAQNAHLCVVEWFTAEAFVDFHVKQEEGSTCQLLMSELSSANVRYTMDLLGRGAKSEVDGLFLATGSDHCVVDLRVNHQAVGCQSRSLIKGIASGQAYGEFKGLVYVATGAQQTDARQTSRNIELSNQAHIVTKPQLEIYADDVKCSHGATVGQLDNEAIYYMRQRGLSELQAQRLQVEGFAADIILRCPIETFCKQLAADVHTKMETL